MEQEHFKAQMNRLAAAYRVDIPAPTRAAYWLAFRATDDGRFAAACERAIEHETVFPSIAALKEIIRQRHEAGRGGPAALGSGAVACPTCLDAGFLRRAAGGAIPCPECAGRATARDDRAAYRALLAREQAERGGA